jgi:RecA-family ATPase
MPIAGLDYIALSREEEPWIIHRILPVSGIAVLFGSPKAGKTFAAMQLACAVAGGLPEWLGIPIQHHGPVLYMQVDMARQDFLARYVDPTVDMGYDITNVFFEDKKTVPMPFNTLGDGGAFLKASIESMLVKPVLTIVDTYRDIHGGDENDSGVTRNIITTLRATVGDSGILIVHHSRKLLQDQVADIIQDVRGSSGFTGSMDGFLRLYSPENTKTGTLTYKSRASDQTSIALARLDNGFWRTRDGAEIMVIQEILKKFPQPGATQQQQNILIANRLGCTESTARRKRVELGLL